MSESVKDPNEIRKDLMARVAAERKKMVQATVDRHGLTGVDVNKLAGLTTPELPPAEKINPELLKEDEDDEGSEGGVRSEPADTGAKKASPAKRGRARSTGSA